jgi:integrase
LLAWDANEGKHKSALEGFGVRVTANGKKAYVVQARVNGATRRVVLGACNLLPLSDARQRAQRALTDMRVDGVDLTKQKRDERTAAQAQAVQTAADTWTLQEVMERYLKERRVNDQPLKPRTQHEIRRHVETNFGDWAPLPVAGIGRDAVKARFAKLRSRSPSQAKQAMGVLRALLTFARDEAAVGDTYPILAVNPVQVALRRQLKPNEGRERMVPLDKVRDVWRMLAQRRATAIPDSSERTGLDMVAFGLLTGCRLGEAQQLKWTQINLDEGWWQITAEVAKDRKARTLPLCTAAVELLRQREPRHGNPHVFPSRTVAGRTFFKATAGPMAHVGVVAGLHLSFHDLRRTMTAVGGECRIEEWRIELLTSHVPTNITGRHYRQRYDVRYLREDAEVIGRWITATNQT